MFDIQIEIRGVLGGVLDDFSIYSHVHIRVGSQAHDLLRPED